MLLATGEVRIFVQRLAQRTNNHTGSLAAANVTSMYRDSLEAFR
jgi:hypothetical protein